MINETFEVRVLDEFLKCASKLIVVGKDEQRSTILIDFNGFLLLLFRSAHCSCCQTFHAKWINASLSKLLLALMIWCLSIWSINSSWSLRFRKFVALFVVVLVILVASTFVVVIDLLNVTSLALLFVSLLLNLDFFKFNWV